MLAIPAFRRLWTVTAVTSTGEWLSILAMTSLATHLAAGSGYTAQSFALGGTVAAKLLPSLLFGPLAGALADRFDRRKLMATCDLLKFGLLISIPIVGSLWWLLAATFLIELCAMFWIPAKDAAVPNLLRRPDQMETAAQLGLVVTYGVAVAGGAGLFALVTKFAPLVDSGSPTTAVYIALFVNSFAFLFSALMIWFRIPELSGRPDRAQRAEAPPSMMFMLRDGFTFVATTPLIRGLVIGIIGAFTAGGAVIATAKLYSSSLGGGDAAYSILFVAVFGGLALGMAAGPRLAQRLPHNRLFGTAIVGAGLSLVVVAVAVHLFMAIVAVMFVGGFAGVAFLTGLTIIGTQVADEIRGRINAFVQSLVRLVLLGAMSLVPIVVGVVATRTITIGGTPFLVDGTRFVLAGAGIVAAVVGTLAYRQMDDRRLEPLLTDLVAALRQGERRTGSGMLVAVEGATAAETARQAERLAAALRERGHRVVEPDDDGDEGPLGGRDPRGEPVRCPRQGARRGRGARRPGRAGRPACAGLGRRRRDGPVHGQPAGPVRRGRRADGRRAGRRRAREPGQVGDRTAAPRHVRAARPRPGRRWRCGGPGRRRRARPGAEAAGSDGRGGAAPARRRRRRRHRGRGRRARARRRAPAGPRPGRGGADGARRPGRAGRGAPGHVRHGRPPAPMSVWDDVVGQPAAVAELGDAASHPASMTHAWLFTGPPGSGRSIAARAFAAALECPDRGCGQCASCRTVMSGTHADVREIVPEGLSISVAEMRSLVQLAARKPSTAPWQIVIIADADRLTEGASNALLKAVEEPAPETVFLLCAPSDHPDDVPVTIRSRCRLVHLRAPSAEAVAGVLRDRDGIDPEQAEWAASVSGGHVGRARRLARDPQARSRREAILAVPTQLHRLGDAFFARGGPDPLGGERGERASRAARRVRARGAGHRDGRGWHRQGRRRRGPVREGRRARAGAPAEVPGDAHPARRPRPCTGGPGGLLPGHRRRRDRRRRAVHPPRPRARDPHAPPRSGRPTPRCAGWRPCWSAGRRWSSNVKPRIAVEAMMTALHRG